MELIIQPDDGVTTLIKAIDSAQKTIEIAIFRFDRTDIQHALDRAVARGVAVRALVAYTNHGGDGDLRKLEMEFLRSGVEVVRTADDLLRYHYKFMIIDHQALYMLTFNYTYLDIGSTRSFAIVTRNPGLVREAGRLFDADLRRQTYTPEMKTFLVSPVNARQELSHFIRGAEHQLLIYDPEISDPDMIRLLRERTRAGVEVRIIGRVSKGSSKLGLHGLMRIRFHTRAIIRDRRLAFLGSQSLREAELDKRRELGLIIHNRDAVNGLLKVFESDWSTLVLPAGARGENEEPVSGVRKRAKALVKDLPLGPLVERALEQALKEVPNTRLTGHKFEHRIEDAVRGVLEDSVSQIVRETVEAEARR